MLTLLTTYPLNTHWVWLRLGATKQVDTPNIRLTDFLDLTTDTCSLSGIVMRTHEDPWRIDVLCYRALGDSLTPTFKRLFPDDSQIQVTLNRWPAPRLIEPTIVLANDSNALAAISMLCAWRDLLPSRLLLWQIQGVLPFNLGPSKIYTPELPPDMIATMLEFEALGVVLRVLSDKEKPGCFHGEVTELLKQYPGLSVWHILSQLPL